MSSRARRTAWVLGLALVLSTALVLTLVAVLTWGPPLARDRIARELSELLGRTITIESIESRPWQGRFGLTGLRVASPAPLRSRGKPLPLPRPLKIRVHRSAWRAFRCIWIYCNSRAAIFDS